MKLRNKKTGEIIEFDAILPVKDVVGDSVAHLEYDSLAELNEEWEDYEEPKEYWFISTTGEVHRFEGEDKTYTTGRKQLGNYFETREEAEKAVEKLKAFANLRKRGLKFDGWDENHHNLGIIEFSFPIVMESVRDFEKDLDLLFGGEE